MIKTLNIRKSYGRLDDTVSVLNGIDLHVPEGDFLSIIGPSGAGKSTLLHILGGLDRPSRGTVVLDGQEIYSLKDADLAKIRNEKIGFVFQFYHLLPEFTALENVIFPALIRSNMRRRSEIEIQGRQLLDQVRLGHRLTHRPNQLSGGEQQRVAIARALMNAPKVIFCDEPTGNLDSKSGAEIVDLLGKLNKEQGQTLVMVTHDEYLARQSKRTVHIKDGRLLDA